MAEIEQTRTRGRFNFFRLVVGSSPNTLERWGDKLTLNPQPRPKGAVVPTRRNFGVSVFFRYGFEGEAPRWRRAVMTASMSRSRI